MKIFDRKNGGLSRYEIRKEFITDSEIKVSLYAKSIYS